MIAGDKDDGADIRDERLEGRRAKLHRLLVHTESIIFSDHHAGDGEVMLRHACSIGLEGVVSKRRDSTYESGSSKAWLKVKNPDCLAARRLVDVTR